MTVLNVTLVFHTYRGWTVSAYETTPPKSIQSPFSMQTQFHQVLLHTLIPSLPTLTSISYFINFKTSTCWNPIMLSTWPNHHSLLGLTSSVMQWSLGKVRKLASALTSKRASLKVKEEVCRTCIHSVLGYVSETWAMNKQTNKLITSVLVVHPWWYWSTEFA